MPSYRDVFCAVLSAALGGWALYKTQSVIKATFDPILAACTGGESDYKLVPHEPLLGGPFVCLITQFVHRLVTNAPAGFIVWAATIATILPVGILMNLEAGRSGAKGLVRYPTLIGFVSIFLAISVSFPLVWVPSFLLFGGSRTGAVLPKRVYASLYLAIPAVVFTILAFRVDVTTYQWTVLAGLLGGPFLVLTTLLLWGMEPKGEVTPKLVAQGATATANAYVITSLMAFGFWIAILKVAFDAYGLDVTALSNALWIEADPCVKFMTVDAIVLFLGTVLFLASIDPVEAILALLLSPGLGPGAACGIMLWGHERVRATEAMAAVEHASKKKHS